LSIGRIRNGGGGAHKWLVTIFVPMILHIPMQLGKVFSFWHLQGDIYYPKKSIIIKNTKPNQDYGQDFLKERKQVFHKKN
jgi:hypothetical protein